MIFLGVVVAYLIGSISTAALVGRLKGVDPTASGDHNAGWWNMRELVGKRWARAVLVGDVIKGALAAALGLLVSDTWWAPYVMGLVAMVGHSFPVFNSFKGGRSILTFAGAMAVICLPAVAMALGLGAVIGLWRSKFSLGLQVAFVAYPFAQALYTPLTHVAAAGVLMTFIGLRFAMARRSDPAMTGSASPSR